MTYKTTYILDTHGLLYQLFHALPPMSSPKGGAGGSGLWIHQRPLRTFRSEPYAEYKANRSEMPDDLKPQIGFVHEILEAFNIPTLSLSGFRIR